MIQFTHLIQISSVLLILTYIFRCLCVQFYQTCRFMYASQSRYRTVIPQGSFLAVVFYDHLLLQCQTTLPSLNELRKSYLHLGPFTFPLLDIILFSYLVLSFLFQSPDMTYKTHEKDNLYRSYCSLHCSFFLLVLPVAPRVILLFPFFLKSFR